MKHIPVAIKLGRTIKQAVDNSAFLFVSLLGGCVLGGVDHFVCMNLGWVLSHKSLRMGPFNTIWG